MLVAEIIMCMHPANEWQSCIVKSSLIGWAHTQNDPCGGYNVRWVIYKYITVTGTFIPQNIL